MGGAGDSEYEEKGSKVGMRGVGVRSAERVELAVLFGRSRAKSWGMQYPPVYPPAYRPPYRPKRRGTGSEPIPQEPQKRVSVVYGRLALSDADIEPFLHLRQQPRDPILAKPNPLRKLPGFFEARDMLRAVRNATDGP